MSYKDYPKEAELAAPAGNISIISNPSKSLGYHLSSGSITLYIYCRQSLNQDLQLIHHLITLKYQECAK
ncbi:Uncharacterized protein HZ326_27600 [Fusarium oxysporum f. sp. albedinis]|nr:Uncharacterized protein HZ326_27600 [Fusarium oxysporum f. sp. albedinis]